MFTNKWDHDDVQSGLQQFDQTGEVINKSIGVWHKKDRCYLNLDLSLQSLIF